jgi:hypothetical protein
VAAALALGSARAAPGGATRGRGRLRDPATDIFAGLIRGFAFGVFLRLDNLPPATCARSQDVIDCVMSILCQGPHRDPRVPITSVWLARPHVGSTACGAVVITQLTLTLTLTILGRSHAHNSWPLTLPRTIRPAHAYSVPLDADMQMYGRLPTSNCRHTLSQLRTYDSL